MNDLLHFAISHDVVSKPHVNSTLRFMYHMYYR